MALRLPYQALRLSCGYCKSHPRPQVPALPQDSTSAHGSEGVSCTLYPPLIKSASAYVRCPCLQEHAVICSRQRCTSAGHVSGGELPGWDVPGRRPPQARSCLQPRLPAALQVVRAGESASCDATAHKGSTSSVPAGDACTILSWVPACCGQAMPGCGRQYCACLPPASACKPAGAAGDVERPGS